MFKPLLRTLPSLTGNISLNCIVDNFYNSESNVWETNIQHASLLALQNNLCDAVNAVSLLNDKWEYSVKTFYNKYSNSFYESNFEYNKQDYVYLDDSNPADIRNTNYEFGCKRILYSKTGYQFNFFAPIYCDNVNDLPDYFEININIGNRIKKTIKINIGKNTNSNYLQYYLKRYLNKINNDVVYLLHESKQATYFGIDIVNGGLIQVKDNVIGQIFNKQNTINNFDNLINAGFQRNKLIMQQIIPLSFNFNINDILTNEEIIKYYFNNNIKITGYYVTGNTKHDFYDFSADYIKFNQIVHTYDKDLNRMVVKKSPYNVMDISYPSLNEAYYSKYRSTNKLTTNYNKWKLKYSNDNCPYITNMSFGFSYIGNTNYNYGEFPIIENSLKPVANIYKHDLQYNSYSDNFVNFENNHTSTWFTAIPNSDNSYDSILERAQTSNAFSDVTDNKVYYNGILYDLSNIYNTTDIGKIDKFGVFVMPSVTITDVDNTIYSEMLIDDTTYNIGNSAITSVAYTTSYASMFVDSNEYNCKISNNEFFTYNETGTGEYIEFNDSDNYNSFYSIAELRNKLGDDIDNVIAYDNVIGNDISYNEISQNTFSNSTRLLDIYNIDNILTNKNDGLSIFQHNSISTSSLQISLNTTSVKNVYNEDILKSSSNYDMYSFFENDSFISAYTFIKYFYNTNNISYYENNILNDLNKYKYVPYKLQNIIDNDSEVSVINTQYFEQKNDDDINTVYIDEYNLNKAANNNLLNKNYVNGDYSENYGLLTSIESLQLWYKNIFKLYVDNNENMNDINKLMFYDKTDIINSVSSYLYVKKRCIISTAFGMYVRDKYMTLYDYLNSLAYKNISVSDFFNSITYDEITHSFTIAELTDELNQIFKNDVIKLYYKAKFYKLTSNLLDLFTKYNYSLLLYRHDTTPADDKTLFSIIADNNLSNYSNVNSSLVPICSTLQQNNTYSTELLKYYINDNIIHLKNNYYEYNIYDVITMINKKIFNNFYGEIANKKTYDIVNSINTKLIKNAKSYNGLNVFQYNNKQYGYYLIEEKFINTNTAFNVNTETMSSKVFKSINGIELSNNVVYEKFNELNCLLNVPMFLSFITNTDILNTIVKPTEFNIKLYYQQYIMDNGNTNDSYKYNSFFIDTDLNRNIYNIRFVNGTHNPKIKLNRYTDKITPYIPKVNNISNLYFLKYKDVKTTISEDNMYCIPTATIYKQPDIIVASEFNNTTKTQILSSNTHTIYERKYYNASTIINCMPEINITLDGEYNIDDINILQQYDKTYSVFEKYLNNYNELLLNDKKQILFLYKKYNVTYIVNQTGLQLNNKLYKLTYKFTLI